MYDRSPILRSTPRSKPWIESVIRQHPKVRPREKWASSPQKRVHSQFSCYGNRPVAETTTKKTAFGFAPTADVALRHFGAKSRLNAVEIARTPRSCDLEKSANL